MTAKANTPLPAFGIALTSLQTGGSSFREFLAEVNRLLSAGAAPADLREQLRQREAVEPLLERTKGPLLSFIDTWPSQSIDAAAAAAAAMSGEPGGPTEEATIVLQEEGPDAANDAALPDDGVKALSPGDKLAMRFEIVELIGEGGMSRVYKARDLLELAAPEHCMALKVLTRPIAEDSDIFAALCKEVGKLRSLSHPNIVRMHDCHHEGAIAFITMELIAGASLYAALRAGNSPPRVAVIRQVASALQYAHEHDVVHGDLKPGNVMLTQSGLKVIDFGIAALVARPPTVVDSREVAQTRNALAVTPRYASPQLMARNAPTPADDVYALACLAYEVMTGVHPFDVGDGAPQSAFPPPQRRGLTKAQYSAIVGGLQFERHDRTDSIAAFITEFERPGRLDTVSKRSKIITAAAALALASLVIIGWNYWRSSKPATPIAAVPPPVAAPVKREEPGAEVRDCPDCAPMKILPAGQFMQGATSDDVAAAAVDKPAHAVTIAAPFAMALNDVTVEDFARFVTATGRDMNGCDIYDGSWHLQQDANWNNPGFPQSARHPVTCVSWSDAVEYAQWMSTKTGHAYRLPSASEWEYAARAGLPATRQWDANATGACTYANVADSSAAQRYPGWKVLDCDDGYVNTSPVGSFQANAFGLSDMLGNVFQWTSDCWHADYENAPADGYAWMGGDCSEHELRGGSWFSNPKLLSASHRNRFTTNYRTSSVGFRLVRKAGS